MDKYRTQAVPQFYGVWWILDEANRPVSNQRFDREEPALDLCEAMNFGARLRSMDHVDKPIIAPLGAK